MSYLVEIFPPHFCPIFYFRLFRITFVSEETLLMKMSSNSFLCVLLNLYSISKNVSIVSLTDDVIFCIHQLFEMDREDMYG